MSSQGSSVVDLSLHSQDGNDKINTFQETTSSISRIVSVDNVVAVDTAEVYLLQDDFPIGSLCNAKSSRGKVWDLATVEGFNTDNTEVRIKWQLSGHTYFVPFTKDNIQSLNETRKRKVKVDLFEDEQHLRALIGLRKLKKVEEDGTGLLKRSKTEGDEVKHRVFNHRGTTIDEVRAAEAVGERSLSAFVDQIKPFIGPKVYERMRQLSLDKSCHSSYWSETDHSSILNGASVSITTKLEQPHTIKNAVMRDYQILGLSWMVSQYDKCINSILADEMGLGKTIQTISFISYLKDTRNVAGPHLVVVPLSVMFNWIAECRKFCPNLRVFRLHSNSVTEQANLKKKLPEEDAYDVCITSYETVKSQAFQGILHRIVWRTVVLDEGHRVKNMENLTSKACQGLRARFKLILTGTPVQNNLRESFSLLHYLCPKVFELEFSNVFDECFNLNAGSISVDRKLLDAAHYLMRPFVLRRIKTEVEQKLPPKLETMIKCPLSDMQRFWTRRLLLKESDTIMQATSEDKEVSTARRNDAWKKLQSLLSQLRKAANHPYLFPGAEDVSTGDEPCGEDIVTASGKMMILDKMLAKLHSRGHRVVLFSQYTRTLDIINDYLDMRGYNHCRLDGSTNRVMREVWINQFNKKDSKLFVFCLSTRAGGEGVNLFSADTVILFDSDWNPQKDIQAMARVHRIGQTKPVHIYRFVSEGTVEERIVQRAQKKLFLDSMINRGSTAQSLEIDEQLSLVKKNSVGAGDDEDGEDDKVDMSTMMSALKFGWNACFSATKTDPENAISDHDLNAIIDRTRGITSAAEPAYGSTSSSSSAENKAEIAVVSANSSSNQLVEGVQNTVADFDEEMPFTSLRLFEGENIKTAKSNTMGDISKEWIQLSARNRTSRLVQEHVVGVGKVNVLKSNNYSLLGGEPSVFDKEQAGYRDMYKEVKRKKNVFTNQDFCQVCWTYGSLVCCDMCPASYHTKCADLKCVPNAAWKCPHHQGCAECGKALNMMGFTFRCEMCPNSYCEDCLPADHQFVGLCDRFTDLGFKLPGNACFIHCSASCEKFALAQQEYFAPGSADVLHEDNTPQSTFTRSNKGPKGSKKKMSKAASITSSSSGGSSITKTKTI